MQRRGKGSRRGWLRLRRWPDQAAVLAGALALESLCAAGGATRETLDAAAGLKVLARGGKLELDAAGQARAGSLPAHLRALAEGDKS
jgi:hypothetical protein